MALKRGRFKLLWLEFACLGFDFFPESKRTLARKTETSKWCAVISKLEVVMANFMSEYDVFDSGPTESGVVRWLVL